MTNNETFIEMALAGCRQRMADLRLVEAELLGMASRPKLVAARKPGKRSLSADARKKIADAQRKRWAAHRRQAAPKRVRKPKDTPAETATPVAEAS